MRKSTAFFCCTATLIILTATMIGHARITMVAGDAGISAMSRMVRELELTDLCLFTEASYTRNPSQTDMTTPFQDHPFAIEHFPAGSLLPPVFPMGSYAD